ncbi:hypothetical protein XENOCAPTIV_031030 [Xenoophorus captivus]|uniref:Uncharacterized protein n=1 Tax=Xenoophorus captivus TaxID=1517983 RepID=A0ABV0QP06_9TELE
MNKNITNESMCKIGVRLDKNRNCKKKLCHFFEYIVSRMQKIFTHLPLISYIQVLQSILKIKRQKKTACKGSVSFPSKLLTLETEADHWHGSCTASAVVTYLHLTLCLNRSLSLLLLYTFTVSNNPAEERCRQLYNSQSRKEKKQIFPVP